MTIASNITQIRMTGLGSRPGGPAGGAALTFDTSKKTFGYTASSERYKKDIMDIDNVYSIEEIFDKLRPVSFKWKSNDMQDFGLISEEVDLVLKDLVCYNSDGTCETVAYHKLPTILLSKMKIQDSKMKIQDSKIEQLTSELLSLKSSIEQLLLR
jgi:hypothetical protein